jgi:3-deoxy-manno-octulosonate cytidylyltransferase (CMP-KDO synthetase)
VVTAAVPFSRDEAADDPAQVKVVVDEAGNALYFSRARIPYPRGEDPLTPRLHVGLYVFRREPLIRFARLEPSGLERTEKLEQLRALENRMVVRVVDWPRGHRGIDTEEDYREFVGRYREGQ